MRKLRIKKGKSGDILEIPEGIHCTAHPKAIPPYAYVPLEQFPFEFWLYKVLNSTGEELEDPNNLLHEHKIRVFN